VGTIEWRRLADPWYGHLSQWPLSGVWVIGLFDGIELLFSGVSWVTLGLSVRAGPKPPHASRPINI